MLLSMAKRDVAASSPNPMVNTRKQICTYIMYICIIYFPRVSLYGISIPTYIYHRQNANKQPNEGKCAIHVHPKISILYTYTYTYTYNMLNWYKRENCNSEANGPPFFFRSLRVASRSTRSATDGSRSRSWRLLKNGPSTWESNWNKDEQ